jgi:ribonuclease VapC
MIAIDTSALMAILLSEPSAEAVMQAIESADGVCMSAGTLAEAMIVAERRKVGAELAQLVEGLAIEVVPVTASDARAAADAYRNWGKGIHPAGLNFGDCFAYALAAQRGCPLLQVGDDFAATDATLAISRGAA